jgi:hypothetical protein
VPIIPAIPRGGQLILNTVTRLSGFISYVNSGCSRLLAVFDQRPPRGGSSERILRFRLYRWPLGQFPTFLEWEEHKLLEGHVISVGRTNLRYEQPQEMKERKEIHDDQRCRDIGLHEFWDVQEPKYI